MRTPLLRGSLLLAGLLALPLPAQVAAMQGGMGRFLDYSEHLGPSSVAVVIGTLAKISDGKRERMKEGEGGLGEGGKVLQIAGTTFYRVQTTARVEVREVLTPTKPAATLMLAFPVQSSGMPDGTRQRHFLTTPRALCEEGMTGLFVVGKDPKKDAWSVLAAQRLDPKGETGGDPYKSFVAKARDGHAINQRVADLRVAVDDLRRTKSAASAKELKELLARKLELVTPEAESFRSMQLAPLEKRAREALEAAGHDGKAKSGDKDGAADPGKG
ncbi:MAG: hypothetical protein IT458_08790 [Planctomycetes bacterium]|nr:hypothetical protein [Planctomycetota bacterium]